MSAFTPYLQNKILDHIFRGVAYTAPVAGVYLSLHTDDPGTTGAHEVTGTNYDRLLLPFASLDAASGGMITTNDDLLFPTAGSAWGDIAWVGANEVDTAGNFLARGELPAVKPIGIGDVFKITAANLNWLFS